MPCSSLRASTLVSSCRAQLRWTTATPAVRFLCKTCFTQPFQAFSMHLFRCTKTLFPSPMAQRASSWQVGPLGFHQEGGTFKPYSKPLTLSSPSPSPPPSLPLSPLTRSLQTLSLSLSIAPSSPSVVSPGGVSGGGGGGLWGGLRGVCGGVSRGGGEVPGNKKKRNKKKRRFETKPQWFKPTPLWFIGGFKPTLLWF